MATNKQASIRYQVLDKCFSNPVKKYFIDDLLGACNSALQEIDPDSKGIQRRQLFDDIKHMESAEGFNAPIGKYKDGKRTYYRYSEKNYSINNQPLNQSEAEQLRSALNILSRFQGLPQFGWVNELMPKLEQTFLLEKNTSPIIGFDNNQYLKGIEHLGRLFNDILYKRVLSISYQSYKNTDSRVVVLHPYYLKQYNNRWFLFGLNEDLQKLSNLALDRILAIDEHKGPFIVNTLFDPGEYFEDIIGVSYMEDIELEKIELAFHPITAPYILSKPLHGSQKKIAHSDQQLIVSIEVRPNYELESLILSFGERVKVLAPESLRQRIVQRLEEMRKGYEE